MKQQTSNRRSWAWRYLSHEARLALVLLHRMPRGCTERAEAAQGLRDFLAKRMPRGILGWSEGRSMARAGDSTGVYHAIITEQRGEYVVSRAACNPQRMTYGSFGTLPSHGHTCRACAKIAAKQRKRVVT